MQMIKQIYGFNTITDETIRPVQLKYCVEANWPDFIIGPGFIDHVLHHQKIYDYLLKTNLESNVQQNKDDVAIEALADIF